MSVSKHPYNLHKTKKSPTFEVDESKLDIDQFIGYKLLRKERDKDIIDLKTIKKYCMRYRLRFLDFEHFRGDIPTETAEKIVEIENRYDLELKELKVMAPEALFKLSKKNKSPILLAQLGKDAYLVIHQWGNEWRIARSLKAFPFQTPLSLLATVSLFSLIMVSLNALAMYDTHEKYINIFSIIAGWMYATIGMSIFTLFVCISKKIYPTSMMWNSRFWD